METYYVDTLGKVNRDTTISLYGDFHYNTKEKSNRYNKVLDELDKVSPNYIFILGDFIEDTTVPSIELEKAINYLSLIASIAPVYYINGNHELRAVKDGEELSYINPEYFHMLHSIPSLHVLDNESVLLDENIGLTGVSLPFNFYIDHNEDKDDYLKFISNCIINNLLGNLDNNSFNILLQHTPNNMFDKEIYLKVLEMIKMQLNRDFNFDVAVFGHLHNGLVPIYLERLFPGNKGLIGIAGKKRNLFQDNCRGTKHITDDTMGIILPAVSALPTNPILNKFFPPSGKTLILKK